MRISIIGTGYVGLITGACFAESGNDVICMDINEDKIKMLNNSEMPFYEPGLEEIVQEGMSSKRLLFTTNLDEALQNSLISFICVPTPSNGNGEVNLNYVLETAHNMGKVINDYKIIVGKSTTPPGTSRNIKKIIKEELAKRKKDVNFDIVSNPEFLTEGNAIGNFKKPDRIVIGLEKNFDDSEKLRNVMDELYHPFLLNQNPILYTGLEEAELVKYVSNAFLATKISFINQIASLCEKYNADIEKIRNGIGLDPRIGKVYFYPSPGFGGSCLPKDVKALIQIAKSKNLPIELLEAVDKINERQTYLFFEKIKNYYQDKGSLEDKILTIWGLSFKPLTDDIREAPSLKLINYLLNNGVRLNVHDPKAMENVRKVFGNNLNYFYNRDDALNNSYGLIIMTEWSEFRSVDFERIKSLLKIPVIFDGKNIYNKSHLIKLGFDYFGVGK